MRAAAFVVGLAFVTSFLVVGLGMMARDFGWRDTLGVVGVALGFTAVLLAGMYLISWGLGGL